MNNKNASKEYVVKGRRLACENTRFKVFFDHLEGKNGFSVSDYLVVAPKQEAEGMVTGVAILPIVDDRYALINVYRHAIGGYLWEVPRGFIEANEESIKSAMRELEEETGLYCERKDIFSLGYVMPEPGLIAARIHLFVATRCQRRSPYIVTEMGHRNLELFDNARIENMISESAIQDPCTLVAYYRYKYYILKRL